jgi:hypothetical protein
MAVASLTRFTVPVASDQSATAQGLLMPKLQYRFRVMFENFGISTPRTELTKQVVDFTRPEISFDEVTIEIYNSRVKLAGKHNWGDATVNIRDDALGNVSRLIGEQLQRQFDFFEQSSAGSGIDYKFVTRCEMLDGGNGTETPQILETWEMYGCFLQSVNYNQVQYSSSEPVQITMTIRFDNALQKPDGAGVGSIVPRLSGVTATG